jgi:hypothetical protein
MADSNTLLYTMSTVAESLGSAMALLAAFALYRLQSISSQMQDDASKIVDSTGRWPDGPQSQKNFEYWTLLAGAENWGRLLPLIDEVRRQRGENEIDAPVRARINRLHTNYERGIAVRCWLWVALILTAVVMAGSVLALAHPDYLARHPCLDVPKLGAHGFCLCLVSYVGLIWQSLGSRRGPVIPAPQ